MASRAAALCTLALVALLSLATPAFAHSFVERTQPREDATIKGGPRRVVLHLSEPVEVAFSEVRVTNLEGDEVHRGKPFSPRRRDDVVAVRLDRNLRGGPYAVTWRIVAEDGHVRAGAFGFFVAAGEAPPEAQVTPEVAVPPPISDDHMPGTLALSVLRGVTTAALLVLAGVSAFWVLAWRGRGARLSPAVAEVEAAMSTRTASIAAGAGLVAMLSSLAALAVYPGAAAGVSLLEGLSRRLFDATLGTRFAQVTIARLVVVEMLAVAALALLWRPASRRGPSMVGAAALRAPLSPVRVAGGAVLIIGMLATVSAIGHAATTPPVALHLTLDVLHLVAAAAWLGGLVAMAAGAFPATRTVAGPDRVALLAPVVTRFSVMASMSIAVLVATGTARAWGEVGSLAALTSTGYGRALLGKVGLFAALALLGAVNHWWARPRVRAAANAGSDTVALRVLRRTVQTETALGVVVLVITAVLVSLPPGR
jgi:copper transport protein